MKAPAIIAQLVSFPEGEALELITMLHVGEKSQLNPDLGHNPTVQSGHIALLDKSGQALVADRDDSHQFLLRQELSYVNSHMTHFRAACWSHLIEKPLSYSVRICFILCDEAQRLLLPESRPSP